MFTIEPRNVSIFEHGTQSSYKHVHAFLEPDIRFIPKHTAIKYRCLENIYTLDLISTSALCGVGITMQPGGCYF